MDASRVEEASRSVETTVVREARCDGHTNMSRDVELFRRASQEGVAGVRIYEWNGPWVSLGRFQDPTTVIPPGSVTPWVIRPTGGAAVLHGHDLTVGAAAPVARLGSDSRKMKAIYRLLVAPIVAALNECGVSACLGEESAPSLRSASPDCFATCMPNDVVDFTSGRKLVGCALRVTREAALVQCSIPVTAPLVRPDSAILGGVYTYPSNLDANSLERALTRAYESLLHCVSKFE